MKINKVDHICIAVKDLDAAKKIWEPLLGKQGPTGFSNLYRFFLPGFGSCALVICNLFVIWVLSFVIFFIRAPCLSVCIRGSK